MRSRFVRKNIGRGISMVETILAVAIFAFVAASLYGTAQRVLVLVRMTSVHGNMTALMNEQFEVVRNLPYADVGTVGGIPSGKLPSRKILTHGDMLFFATTTVRNIDEPFDGVASGTPNDLSPADNKLIEIEIGCLSCSVTPAPLVMTTSVAPKDLEGSSTNGSLFVRAIDASGQPIPGAEVHLYNGSGTTTITVDDVTSSSGMLQVVDAPPGNEAYEITVTKSGYSSERTYTPGGTIANPLKPHATVVAQTVTQLSFAIDRLATLPVSSVAPSCAAVPNVGFQLTGSKLLGTSPDILKYDTWNSTGGAGVRTLSDIEWDTYTLSASSTTYDLAGVVPLVPFTVTPGATQNIQLIMVPKDPPAVLVTVKDGATGLPVSDALVTLEKGASVLTQTTGRGFLRQTDWSGGSGQSLFSDETRYDASDGSVDTITTPGEVVLRDLLGQYQTTGELTSSTFDTGSPSNFYQFTYQPTNQPTATGETSVGFQLATSNATSSAWTYLGPDGTGSTYYTATTTDIASMHSGDRYLRYKMYLSTASSTQTPNISDIQFTFTSSCVPPGQVIFQGLASGTWDVTVSKTGYASYVGSVIVGATPLWQEKQVSLSL